MKLDEVILPIGWEACWFGDIAKIRNGYAFKSELFKKTKEHATDVPLIRQSQMKGARIDISDAVYLSGEFLKKHPDYVIAKGDVIIGMSGSIGKVCLYDEDFPALQNQRTGKIVPLLVSELDPKFFGLFLSNIERKLTEYAKGMGVQNISSKDIEQLPFNLPPKNEQRRIVAKIEELFSELDKGIENLKTAQAQLKVYRQALLKHAFEGKLTAQWRAANPDKLEPAAALLARIQTEREQRYRQQLQQWQATGGNKPKAPKPLPPLTAEELAKLPVLPEGWGWVKTEEVCSSVRDGTHDTPKYVTKGIPLVTSKNLRDGRIDFSDTQLISEEDHELVSIRSAVDRGDVLYAMIGTIGNPVVVSGAEVFSIKNVALFKRNPQFLDSKFLSYWLGCAVCDRVLILLELLKGTTQKFIPLGNLRVLPMPICTVLEQQQIVQELESKLSEVEQLDQTLAASLQQSEALRQSILKKAFSGELVAQDANDEPAAALLARIKAERDNADKPKRKVTA